MTPINEIAAALKIGNELIDELKKQYPKMKIGEAYNGKFAPYMMEYINTFIAKDCKAVKDYTDKEAREEMEKDLCQEMMFIECFCKWLDEEKGIEPRVKNDI